MSVVELRSEVGKVSAFCGECGWKMVGTTAKIEQLPRTGAFDVVESFCTKCGATARIKLQVMKTA